MSHSDQQLISTFAEALACESTAAREAYLDSECGNNTTLRTEVEALLKAHEGAGNFLKGRNGPSEFYTASHSAHVETAGDMVGPYKLLEQIGEGGMGIVYMAEQQAPIRRGVALKIIKAGMDTRQVIARFEAERQALALMDHSNIARVLEAGATESGRPYFVMELVRGVPITEYCDQESLPVPSRLELFVQVCHAVQHAHQKGIIHRDLKPTNVLVAIQDDRPTPKIIDFGVAKAVGQQLTEKTLFTNFAQMVGTPLYMSPEQAELTRNDVDTRSDIYSLGVLLYELLTGTTPFDQERMRSAGFDEIRRIIRDEEPPKPSARIRSLGESGSAVRGAPDAKRLAHLVAGDLDWIVMRCLEKDRARRYGTANALAQDVEHYLNDEPVEASPPSRAYRLKRFLRRNKVAVLIGTIVFAALVSGLTIAAVGFLRVRAEAARSEQVKQYLEKILNAARPGIALGRDTTLLSAILDEIGRSIATDLNTQPKLQGDLSLMLGGTYSEMGDSERAVHMYEQSVESYLRDSGPESADIALALGYFGRCQALNRQHTVGKENARRALDMARRVGNPETLAICLDSMAQALTHSGEKAVGIPYQREAVELRRKLGNSRTALGNSIGWLALDLGVDPMAESLSREAIALHRQDDSPDQFLMIADLWNLGRVLMANSKFEEAEPVFRETLEKCQEINSQDHGLQGQLVWHLAITLTRQNKWSEAESFTRKATDTMPNNGYHWNSLGRVLACRDNWQAAVDPFRSAVRIMPDDYNFKFDLALALLMAGNQEESEQVCHQYLEKVTNDRVMQNPQFTDKAAMTMLLLPVEGGDFERACQWADYVEHTNDNPSQGLALGHLTKALAESRKAHYQSAIDLAQSEIDTKQNGERQRQISSAQANFIKAAAYARQGQLQRGNAAFATGDELFTLYRQELRLIGWWDLAVTNYLRGEANELLSAASTASENAESSE